jgi:hypothetical protein
MTSARRSSKNEEFLGFARNKPARKSGYSNRRRGNPMRPGETPDPERLAADT